MEHKNKLFLIARKTTIGQRGEIDGFKGCGWVGTIVSNPSTPAVDSRTA
jgi:hypothetical protein